MTPPMNPSSKPPSTILEPTLNLAVALVEPRIPQNTGNIARLCACTGSELFLIGDLGFQIGDKYLERAGMDYLKGIELTHLPDFPDLLKAKPGYTPFYVSTKATQAYTDVVYPEKTVLVFGSEDKGLPKWVMAKHPEQSIRIPMLSEARSLNLSNAVSIVVYEVLRQKQALLNDSKKVSKNIFKGEVTL